MHCLFSQTEKVDDTGYWYGQLELMGTRHKLLFEVKNRINPKNNKPLKRKIDMFILHPDDSSRLDIATEIITLNDKQSEFVITGLKISFRGH